MPRPAQHMQLAVREKRGEPCGDARIQIPVRGAEDHPDRWLKSPHLRNAESPGGHRAHQVVVETPERWSRRQELLIQLGHHPGPYRRVLNELANLPRVEPLVQFRAPQNCSAKRIADQRCRIQCDRRRTPQCWSPVVIGVEEHQHLYLRRISECPVDRWWTGSIVGDQDQLVGTEVLTRGTRNRGHVACLVCSCVWVAFWFV